MHAAYTAPEGPARTVRGTHPPSCRGCRPGKMRRNGSASVVSGEGFCLLLRVRPRPSACPTSSPPGHLVMSKTTGAPTTTFKGLGYGMMPFSARTRGRLQTPPTEVATHCRRHNQPRRLCRLPELCPALSSPPVNRPAPTKVGMVKPATALVTADKRATNDPGR